MSLALFYALVPSSTQGKVPAMAFDPLWLPEGHIWDLHIEHNLSHGAGSFTGGGWKLPWHTTESPWFAVDAMVGVLRAKDACPHFCIGGRSGLQHPVVVQLLPLNVAGRALQNDSGDGYQTNRANAIQVEICGQAAAMGDFSHYKALANLFELITHRQPIENWTHADAGTTPPRFSDATWVSKQGHVGHNMAPDNDHTDPGVNFRWGTLQNLVRDIPDGGYDL